MEEEDEPDFWYESEDDDSDDFEEFEEGTVLC